MGKLKEFNSLVPADLKLEEDQLEAVVGLVGADQPQPVLIPALLTLLRWPAPQVLFYIVVSVLYISVLAGVPRARPGAGRLAQPRQPAAPAGQGGA